MNWIRDIGLLLVALVIIGLLLLPAKKEPADESKKIQYQESVTGQISAKKEFSAGSFSTIPGRQYSNIEHILFPLEKGSTWRYLVSGTDKLVPALDWTIHIVKVPTPEEEGIVEAGFGQERKKFPVFINNEELLMSAMPFTAPLPYLESTQRDLKGSFLPKAGTIIDNAVWKRELLRDIIYRNLDNQNNIIDEPAVGRQTDWATAKEIEKVIVPAGIFHARKIEWLSRLEVETKSNKRKVLKELTTQPFRKETAWFVEGLGMVRRRVTYLGANRESIVFDLVSYDTSSL